MLRVRRAADRGHVFHGWLDAWHTFSFGRYFDPGHTGFRSLRVLNDDRVAPGAGFPEHSHASMEIVSWIVEGTLVHRDSTGQEARLGPGEAQWMSAGSGIVHSEFNGSQDEPLRFLQLWIEPAHSGGDPLWDRRRIPAGRRRGRWAPIAAPGGRDGALSIRQDAILEASLLDPGETLERRLGPGRHAWLQVVRGAARAGGRELSEGDGLAVSGEPSLTVEAVGRADLLLIDLA